MFRQTRVPVNQYEMRDGPDSVGPAPSIGVELFFGLRVHGREMDRDATYPGEMASAVELHRLACAHGSAARALASTVRRGDPVSTAPMRLLAVQAIELHLTACLVAAGTTACDVRRLGHGLSERARMAAAAGLILRRRTAMHLGWLDRQREYLVARYGPERLAKASQINRLTATLDEVGGKVGARIAAEPPTIPLTPAPGAGRPGTTSASGRRPASLT